ncbi:MAG: SGNH/GDSL hydrolase family protein [Anaerolineae bacterium]|nr:SGNH/GDSL hydrolase family protein [Anaerolineae bacterium]
MSDSVRLWRVLVKAATLFVLFNVLWYAAQPLDWLNRLSVYGVLFPPRERFPFAEFPEVSYAVTVNSLEQLFASHAIARPKAADEFRVVMLGDSAIWGYLLRADQTQAACINALELRTEDGRRVRAYNLGYPTLTVIKDFLILRRALVYQSDLIIWSTSLASLYPSDQLDFPLILAHREEVSALQAQYAFKLDQYPLPSRAWQERTFFGQRRDIADWLRHQLYAPAWASTRIDHVLPRFVAPHPVNLLPDDNVLSVNVLRLREAGKIAPEDLNFDVLKAGVELAAAQGVPTVLVNEPIYRNESHPLRYNTYYPRWAYDGYRVAFQQVAEREGWRYFDLWDAVPPDQFTDTDFHMTPSANCAYAEQLIYLALDEQLP